jgi:hypothetical protein
VFCGVRAERLWVGVLVGEFSVRGGGLEYLHRNHVSCKRRRKRNPVPRDITGPPCSWGYKCGELVLQVGRVSHETVIYGYESFATLTSWVMCTAKYRPVLSSERAPYMKKEVHDHGPQRAARHHDVLADWPSVANSTALHSGGFSLQAAIRQ